jgi:uncharacterized membrane protein YbhN (UPF0104 family)
LSAALRSRATLIGLVVGVPLSAVFLWLAVRNADLDEVWSVLGSSDLVLVSIAVVALGGVYLGQAVRWREIARTPSVSTARFGRWSSAVSRSTTSSRVASAISFALAGSRSPHTSPAGVRSRASSRQGI